MQQVYPIVLTPTQKGGYAVSVPDLNIDTQGDNLAEAMYMARDAIGMWICYEQDAGRSIPSPSCLDSITAEPNEIKTLIDVDTDEYRRTHDNRTVRKNCTLPSWLNERAEKAGVNFSLVLQEALKDRLGLNDSPRVG
ncbi:MAG: type II toxin-antitoxin system HicB family antitoxin [Selenomonadales bacterium]|nr:type II toxin-antitoxin system HicB family antitoxin [Selenomonadales bacterium]